MALAAILTLMSSAALAAPAALTRLPAQFRGGDVFLQVQFRGHDPVWMKLDLAAKGSTMSPMLAREVGSAPAGGNDAVRTDIGLGKASLPGVTFGTSDGWVGPDDAPAGLLGGDFLGDRVLVIKYREQQVWLSPPITPAVPTSPSAPALMVAARQ